VTEVSGELFSALPEQLRQLLSAPPLAEKKLLELSVTWSDLPPQQARTAEQLRLFAITWDPLERLADRPEWFATVNPDPPGFELVVYVPVWSLVESAAEQGITAAAVLAAIASSAVLAAAHRQPVTPGRGAGLVAPLSPGAPLESATGSAPYPASGTPDIGLVSPGWEDIGLGAITDIVQHAFGPVDLDRSTVKLAAAAETRPGCVACAGRRFGFPGELAEALAMLCPAHRDEAEAMIRNRLQRDPGEQPGRVGCTQRQRPPAGVAAPAQRPGNQARRCRAGHVRRPGTRETLGACPIRGGGGQLVSRPPG
jgi:hypothetical protein